MMAVVIVSLFCVVGRPVCRIAMLPSRGLLPMHRTRCVTEVLKMRRRWIIVLAVFSVSFLAYVSWGVAQGDLASSLNGNEYRRMPENFQLAYIGGVFDGVSVMAGISPETRIASCLRSRYHSKSGVTTNQVVAIVNLYLSRHPEQWNFPMAAITVQALGETCGF